MKVVLFSIGKLNIYGYGAMIALGIIAAVVITLYRCKKYYNINPDMYFNAAIIGIAAGLLGAKITYWLVEIKEVIANPKIMLDLGGGFVVYGGLVLGVLTPVIYLKYIKKTTALDKLDIAMPAISLGQAFGRIGCFLAGCCYGKPVPEGAWYGITFPAGADAPSGVPLYPTQLMSVAGNLLLFGFLLWYTNREKFRGEVVCLYAFLYSVGRFLIEFLRNDPRGSIGPFSTTQFLCLFSFAGSIVFWLFLRHKNWSPVRKVGPYVAEDKKEKKEEEPAPEMKAEEAAENAEEKAEETVNAAEEKVEETVEKTEA